MMPTFALRCRDLFEQALPLAPHERARLLDDQCGGDAILRVEVQRLLGAHDVLGAFLEIPPAFEPLERDPVRLGGYDVVRKLGEGGMGHVYLGEPGPVAIKVVRRDLDAALLLQRFARERAMLERLVHPNIARLLGGGTDEHDTPFIVLEYVDGIAIDDYCRRHALGARERLDLFRILCDAVAYAHGRLVVHRDLKPANILVTADGNPVVLDFGLSKLLKTSPAAALESTRTGHRLLTPEYASPEQVRGVRATSRTDIYALGAILYELLAGVAAHRFRTWSLADIVDVVCHHIPSPPSVAAAAAPGPGALAPDQLHGDLDFIVMKALAKAPEQRYEHVAALDDDIRRYLERRPIPMRVAPPYQS